MTYRNVHLTAGGVQEPDPQLTDREVIASRSAMDARKNMEVLHRLGELRAARDVKPEPFPVAFDLPAA